MSIISDSQGAPPPRSALYYRHSGRTPPAAVLMALTIGIAVAIPAAFIYSAADIYIDFIYVRFVFGIGLGVALGAVTAFFLRLGRGRSYFVTNCVVTIVALVGYYAAWVAWICLLPRNAPMPIHPTQLFFRPDTVWNFIRLINQTGTWYLGTPDVPTQDPDNVQGAALWIVWICEAALISGAALFCASKIIAVYPYCEQCGRWCKNKRKLGSGARRGLQDLRRELEAGNFKFVKPLTVSLRSEGMWLDYYHTTCPTCAQINTLTVRTARLVRVRGGRYATRYRTIIDKLLLHPGEAEQLLTAEDAPDSAEAS
jgi:hypothetical protein